MKALDVIKRILGKWWLLLLLFLSMVLIQYFMLFKYIDWLSNLSFYTSLVLFLLLLASIVYSLAKRRWLVAFSTLIIMSLIIWILYMVAMAAIIIDTDHFADDLKIPLGISIYEPDSLERRTAIDDSVISLHHSGMGFQLYNGFQPGIYEYDFWSGKIEDGKIYLKVFEVTKATPLSDLVLPESTAIQVENYDDNMHIWHPKNYFVIYEGDWGKYYAARFEVWFKPSNGSSERKLCERIYKISGWQR